MTTYVASLCVYMLHFPAALDRPSRDCVVVLARETGHRWSSCSFATNGHEFSACWLCVAGFVPRAALQYRRAAVPTPRHAEARESLGLHRFLQCCLCPTLAAIGGHHHL